jgi:hypothetical protein
VVALARRSGPTTPRQPLPTRQRDPWHRRRATPEQAIAFAVVAFLLAALLGSESLVGLARRQPFGTTRTIALGLASGLDRVAHALSLDRPSHLARQALGKDRQPYDVDALISPNRRAGQRSTDSLAAPTTTVPPRKTPSAATPLKVYVGGDSMGREVASGVSQAAPNALSDIETDYRVSTGLARPDFFDWNQRLAQVIVEHKPDVFVLIFGTNDNQNMQTPTGILEAGSAQWLAEYRSRVARVMDLVHQTNTTTLWVGLPPMRSHGFDQAVQAMNAIYREEAARRPWISFIDTRTPFAGADGGYADSLADGGEAVQIRQSDGVHWSTSGAAQVGQLAWRVIARRWDMPGA